MINLSKPLLFGLVFCFIELLSSPCSFAGLAHSETILRLDFNSNNNLVVAEKYLATNDVIDYFTVRQKLLSLPFEKLIEIYDRIKDDNRLTELNNLIIKCQEQINKQGIYLLTEDFLISEKPFYLNAPFYKGTLDFKITALDPRAERLYSNNIRLKTKANCLVQKDEGWWVNKNAPQPDRTRDKSPRLIKTQAPPDFSNKSRILWSYVLPDDHLNDFFFFGMRQYVTRYQEDLMFPAVYQDTVILRNEYRLFSIDRLSGQQLWTLGNLDKKFEERYQTYRHPHQNSYGYEFLLADSHVYTELAGEIIAVDIKEINNPKLLWRQGLGEYTLCTKPVQYNKILVVGVINAKGELWVLGINTEDGNLEWSSYIGISSFLTPVCIISAIKDDAVFMGTNHGILVCLDPNNGKLMWIRAYVPKKKELFSYYRSGQFKDKLLNKGSFPYDTQFLEVDSMSLLYYKPRESDYVYLIDTNSGQLKEAMLIDTERFKIIKIADGNAIFWDKDRKGALSTFRLIELETGKELQAVSIKGNSLQGISYGGGESVFVKINETVYYLKIGKFGFTYTELNTPINGWLQCNEGRFLFFSRDRTVQCLEIWPTSSYRGMEPSPAQVVRQKQELIIDFNTTLQSTTKDSGQNQQLIDKLISGIKTRLVSLSDIYTVIINNLNKLRNPAWGRLIMQMQESYGNDAIMYRDITLKKTAFLLGSGLLPHFSIGYHNKPNNPIYVKDYIVRGNSISLVPIKTVKGEQPCFFLLLNNDQLLCIDEQQNVLWMRRVFCGPVWKGSIVNDKRMYMYSKNIQAYTYDNVLVINDHVNIIAVDALTGAYLWSMTNDGENFREEKQSPPTEEDTLYHNYGIKKSFAEQLNYSVEFLNRKIIVLHGKKIYSINPETGYCNTLRKIELQGIVQARVSYDGTIYIVSSVLDKIIILDKNLNIVGNIPLNNLEKSTDKLPELLTVKNYMFLYVHPYLYIIDKKNARLGNKITIDDSGEFSFETCNDGVILVEPFQKIISYIVKDNSPVFNWEFQWDTTKLRRLRDIPSNTYYYFRLKDIIVLPCERGEKYFFTALDLTKGKKIWETCINGIDGLFFNLSEAHYRDNKIYFSISTAYKTSDKVCPDPSDVPDQFSIVTKLVSIDILKIFRPSLSSP